MAVPSGPCTSETIFALFCGSLVCPATLMEPVAQPAPLLAHTNNNAQKAITGCVR